MKIDSGIDHPESKVMSVGSTYFGELIEATKATPNHEVDDLLQILEAHKYEWANLEISERLLLLDEIRKNLWDIQNLFSLMISMTVCESGLM